MGCPSDVICLAHAGCDKSMPLMTQNIREEGSEGCHAAGTAESCGQKPKTE